MLELMMIPLMIASGFDGVEPPRCTRRTCAAFTGPIHRTTEIRGLGAAARKCGCSHTHLRKVLEGERKPSADLERRMRRLGLKPGELKKEGK